MDNYNIGACIDKILTIPAISKLNIEKNITFYQGDFSVNLSKILREKAYLGKIAIFSFEDTFLLLAKEIKKVLQQEKITSTDILFSKNEKIVFDDIVKTFLMPDDIRAIVVLDASLTKIGGYLSTIKNLPLIVIDCGLSIGSILENSFYIKTNNSLSSFLINCRKYIIIDKSLCDLLNISLAVCYDYLMNNLIGLVDTKISAFFGEDIESELFNLKNKAVTSSFSIMKESEENKYYTLFSNSLICGLINGCQNKLDSLSLISIYYFDLIQDESIKLDFSIKILKLFSLLCKTKENLCAINDYNSLTLKTSEELSINEKDLIDNLIKQEDIFKNSNKNVDDFCLKFREEIIPLANSFSKVWSTHLTLRGKDLKGDSEREKKAIKYSFLLTDKITGLSLLNKIGILNLIEIE